MAPKLKLPGLVVVVAPPNNPAPLLELSILPKGVVLPLANGFDALPLAGVAAPPKLKPLVVAGAAWLPPAPPKVKPDVPLDESPNGLLSVLAGVVDEPKVNPLAPPLVS